MKKKPKRGASAITKEQLPAASAVEACSDQQARAEALELLQAARNAWRGQLRWSYNEDDVVKRLLLAVLESMTPEQRAEVGRRLLP